MRKLLSVVLALCMLCGLVPLTALAVGNLYDVTIEGLNHTVEYGPHGTDAFDDTDSSLQLGLKSETGVIFSETIDVTVGGEDFYNFTSHITYYEASDDTVTLYVCIYNNENGYIDGDVVITLYEETAPRVETLFPTATAVTETKQFEATYTGDANCYKAPDGSSMRNAYDAPVYVVEMEADEKIWVSSYSDEDTDGDTWVLVYGENGSGYEAVDYCDYDGKNNLQESFLFTAPADGKYYFVCSHFGLAEGKYINAFSYDLPEDMTPYLDAATPLSDGIFACDTPKDYLLDDGIYTVVAAFKTAEQQEFLLGTDDQDATISYMVLYKDPIDGYMPAMGGSIMGGTKEMMTLGAEEVIVLLATGKEPYDISIKLMGPALEEVLDFTATPVPTPSAEDKWAWDAAKKELTLKDGFNMRVNTIGSDESAIVLPDGATVIVDGEVYIDSAGYVISGTGALTIKGKTGHTDVLNAAASTLAVLAEGDLLVENCTVIGQGGFVSYTNATLDNVKTSITGLLLVGAADVDPAVECTVLVKNSDITFSGGMLALASKKATFENCVSHVLTALGMSSIGGQAAPIEINGGAITWCSTVDTFDLDLVQIGEDTEFFLTSPEGFMVTDKDKLPSVEKAEYFDYELESMGIIAGYDDVWQYDDVQDVYYLLDEDDMFIFAFGTPYYADMADAKVTSDKKEYAHDATIKVDANALTPAVGVYGNTRLLPVSWKVGDKEGTFEDGNHTIELNAADLGAGEHTVVVTYAYNKVNIEEVNTFAMAPLIRSVWETAKAQGVLSASVTFTVLAQPSSGGGTAPIPQPVVPAPTGDTVSTLPWMLLGAVGAIGLAVLAFTKKRKA